MANFVGQKLTSKGRELLARAQTEEKALLWTKITLGSGVYDGAIEDIEDLINEKLQAKMIESNKLGEVAEVVGRFSNESLENEFEVRELGIYGKIEGDSNSILYSYANSKDRSIMPDKSVPCEIEQTIYTQVIDGDKIDVYIDPQLHYLTKDVADTFYEKIINKLTGFNLDKTDSVSSSNSMLLATAKAVKTAYDKAVEALNKANTKENAFSKNSGFNKNKTDSLTTNDSNILATAKAIKTIWDNLTSHRNSNSNPHIVTKSQVGLGNVPNYPTTSSVNDPSNSKIATAGAVKTTYDKAVEALNKANTKEDAFSKNTGFNKNKTDSLTTNDSNILATAKAIKTIWDNLTSHRNSNSNPHGVTKSQVGLGSVPNYPATSSVNDPSDSKVATAGAVKTAYDKGIEALNKAELKRTVLFNGSTNGTATHGDISSYMFIAIEFRSSRYEHRWLPVEMWLSRGQTAITRRGGENADKDYDAYLTKISNTQTSADGNAVLYKIYGYKY